LALVYRAVNDSGGAAVSDKKPHWRTVDDIRGYVGDRIVAICQWSERHSSAVKRHIITLTIHDDGVTREQRGQRALPRGLRLLDAGGGVFETVWAGGDMMPPNGPPPRHGNIPGHPTSPPPPRERCSQCGKACGRKRLCRLRLAAKFIAFVYRSGTGKTGAQIMSEQPLDIASLMQIEDLKHANQLLASHGR
jgi:hypothetical protein